MVRRFYPDWARIDPFCKPDWRWRRATRLVDEHRPYLPRRDDEATGRCMTYLRDRARGGDLGRRYPDLHSAHELHVAGGDNRLLVEARMLAGQSDNQIACLTGLTQGVVAAFHDSFYDVRDLVERKAGDWVAFQACGHTPGPAVANREVLLRLFGYFSGPCILDLVVPFLTGGFDLSSDAVPSEMCPRLAQTMKLGLRLMLMPDTEETRNRITQSNAGLLAGQSLAAVLESLSTPKKTRGGRPRSSTTPSGAAAMMLHKPVEVQNGVGTAVRDGLDVLLRSPTHGVEGGENLPRIRASGSDGREEGGGRASEAKSGGSTHAGTARTDSSSRGSARPTVRSGDDTGDCRAVRGGVVAAVPSRLEDVA